MCCYCWKVACILLIDYIFLAEKRFFLEDRPMEMQLNTFSIKFSNHYLNLD